MPRRTGGPSGVEWKISFLKLAEDRQPGGIAAHSRFLPSQQASVTTRPAAHEPRADDHCPEFLADDKAGALLPNQGSIELAERRLATLVDDNFNRYRDNELPNGLAHSRRQRVIRTANPDPD
jgi:hypothetical protein